MCGEHQEGFAGGVEGRRVEVERARGLDAHARRDVRLLGRIRHGECQLVEHVLVELLGVAHAQFEVAVFDPHLGFRVQG